MLLAETDWPSLIVNIFIAIGGAIAAYAAFVSAKASKESASASQSSAAAAERQASVAEKQLQMAIDAKKTKIQIEDLGWDHEEIKIPVEGPVQPTKPKPKQFGWRSVVKVINYNDQPVHVENVYLYNDTEEDGDVVPLQAMLSTQKEKLENGMSWMGRSKLVADHLSVWPVVSKCNRICAQLQNGDTYSQPMKKTLAETVDEHVMRMQDLP